MKHLIFYVMIFSLLLALCGCSHDASQDEIQTETETGLPPTVETDTETEQGAEQGQPETNEPETIEGGEIEPVPNDTEQPIPEPPIIEPPIIEPPIIETPPTEPPVILPVVEPPTVEPPPIVEPPTEPPVIPPPIVEPPVVIPPVEPPPVIPPVEQPTEPPVIPPVIEPPIIEINELRPEFLDTLKKVEYIEFRVKRSGNLQGISVHIMHNAANPFVYNFPNIDVALGEYITLHLRTLSTNCVNELGDNLSLSGGYESCPTARDLWVEGSNKYLYKTDIVYLTDASGKIFDAVIMNEAPAAKWAKDVTHFEQISEHLWNVEAWESADDEKPTPYDAVDTSNITSTYKSVSRYEYRANHFNTTDWYVTGTGYTTPGLPNK
ncbi:hypothetical protein R84B8_00642 [Treponema sp. R8-4-B8]